MTNTIGIGGLSSPLCIIILIILLTPHAFSFYLPKYVTRVRRGVYSGSGCFQSDAPRGTTRKKNADHPLPGHRLVTSSKQPWRGGDLPCRPWRRRYACWWRPYRPARSAPSRRRRRYRRGRDGPSRISRRRTTIVTMMRFNGGRGTGERGSPRRP